MPKAIDIAGAKYKARAQLERILTEAVLAMAGSSGTLSGNRVVVSQ